jgi:hypothetical protein
MDIRDTLRIDQATYLALLEELGPHNAPHRGEDRRTHVRYRFFSGAPAVAIFNYRSRKKRDAVAVRPVDVSTGGIAFLHGNFVYRDTPCLVIVRDLHRETHRLCGRVSHSRLVSGRVHAIGLQLDAPLRTELFVPEHVASGPTPAVLTQDKSWTDLLRISENEIEDVILDIEERERTSTGIHRRESKRNEFRESAVIVTVYPDDSERRHRYRVKTTNISSTGIGFLHGAFLYPGTPCEIQLITLDGRNESVRGDVVRCEFVQRNVHEIGVRFQTPIQVESFLACEQEPTSDPASLP